MFHNCLSDESGNTYKYIIIRRPENICFITINRYFPQSLQQAQFYDDYKL